MKLLYAIGDIHGCYEQMLSAVARIKAHADGRPFRAVFLGDYVDRGPQSRQVVALVAALCDGRGDGGTWQALKGNHE
jgi:serine/threonine protein phosphatase 1